MCKIPKMSNDEVFKLQLLKKMFTVNIEIFDPEIGCRISISGCWKFTGFSIEECLDEVYIYIVDSGNRSDEAVKSEYDAEKTELLSELKDDTRNLL